MTFLRTKICTTGIKGLTRKAWETAALSTDTQLNISVVIDCVDKQDVSLARRLFGLDVEQCMLESGIYRDEARFCRLIRQWFEAEDEPPVSASKGCLRRMELREWLLTDYPIGSAAYTICTRYSNNYL